MEMEVMYSRLNRLLEAGRHGELRGALMMLNEVDIAQYMTTLDEKQLVLVFRILPKDISADVFSYMENDQRQKLIESIGDAEAKRLMDDMFLDDAVDFLEEMPAGVVRRLLQSTDENKRNLINRFLSYPENSAGSLMTIEYVECAETDTVKGAMQKIRQEGIDKETVYTLYLIDEKRHLTGVLALRRMLLADEDTQLCTLMDRNFIAVHTLDDQEKVADTVRHYDLMTMPVLDNEDRLVGIITADDIMDVIEDENTEDFEKMAALVPSEEEYLKTSPFRLALNRIPWLLLLCVAATFTGMIITNFENLLQHADITLTACIPMLMDTGGNCGSQASTLMIRGLALGEIQFRDILKVLWKEVRVAVMVGLVLFGVTFARVVLINGADTMVALTIAAALYVTVIIAKAIGCTLPLGAKKLGLDPALMASPLITTIVDAASLTVYFGIASAILHF